MGEETESQRELMRHMLGMDTTAPGVRDYILVGENPHRPQGWADMHELERMGYVVNCGVVSFCGGDTCWRPTEAGRRAVGAPVSVEAAQEAQRQAGEVQRG